MYIGTPLTGPRHRTLCRVGGQLCMLTSAQGAVQPDGTLLVPTPDGGSMRVPDPGGRVLVGDGSAELSRLPDQPGASEEQAAALGLVAQPGRPNVQLPEERVESAFVNLHEPEGELWPVFPGPAMYGEQTQPAVRSDAVAALRTSLAAHAGQDWELIRLECRGLGTRLEVAATVVRAGTELSWIPPEDVLDALLRLRFCSHTAENGPWTGATFEFAPGGAASAGAEQDFSSRTTHDEPAWQYADRDPVPRGLPPEDAERLFPDHDDGHLREYYEELKHFPRDRAALPGWLLDAAWEYHARLTERERERTTRNFDQYRHGVRTAQTFDGRGEDGKPLVYRPALTRAEKQQVLEYLRDGHLVVSAYSTSEDQVDPQRPPEVPNVWLTDGPWLWPAAMTYYLHEHDITPPHEFLDHIRAAAYRVPRVLPDAARERAQHVLMGGDLNAALPNRAAAHEVIEMVRRMIAGLRITKRSYSFEAVVEGAWCMVQEPDGWWSVFLQLDGQRKEEVRVHQVMDAAAHLLGCLSLSQDENKRPPEEPLEDYECIMQPLDGEPPLSIYDGKREGEVQVGYEVDRFGDSAGNTVFVAGTAPPSRGITPEQASAPYRRYRVTAPFEVLVGYVRPRPDLGMPGGGQAYVLPQSVQRLVEGRWLVEL